MSDVRQRSGEADPVDAAVIAPLQRARLAPDDLQLARLGAALDAALQAAVEVKTSKASERRPAVGRRSLWLSGVTLAMVAVATLVLSVRRAPAPSAGVAVPRTALAIAHESVLVSPATGAVPLIVPAGARERGRIGERVRFTLVGPAEVSAFAVGGGTELELASGRLLVEYDGNGEDILRVRSPGAVTTVVGTLFAVEARGRASRVAVARGAVTVESVTAGVRRIGAGRSWLTEALETEPISRDLAAELAAHDDGAARRQATPEPATPAASARPESPLVAGTEVRSHHSARPARDARDAETAYAAAEDLMRAGSVVAARKALLDLVAAHPGDPRAELALLDLARLALAAGHPVEARGYLKRLLAATRDAALVDLGRQIEHRIDAAAAP